MLKQTALITGASSGIGWDLAHLFARDGHDLILASRNEGKLRELATQLESQYRIAARVIPVDLERPDAPRELFEAVQTPVDMLVNNAGFGLTGKFVETDLARELAMIQVNVSALVHLTKLFTKPMVERGQGRILNVASTAAFQPGPLMAVYYASKAFVLSFSEALAEELGGTGVTVTALCPGPTATGFATAANMTTTRLFTVMKPMTSQQVAKIGYNAMKRGRRVVVTGTLNKLLAQSVRVSPRRMVTRVTRTLQENR
jgi:short-subunit dehydrogenase